ncbi:DNA segregation protein PrgO [Enterococcus gallinarum]|uniref:DNA segregation protein PrgO n=1 Tax=Enterococcus gallinarum TaxID=1353 RepID=A0ABD4ZYC5_ENTGA|nr:DNA segregation protein PrgO [Enterococcus gallinarum]MBF0825885.1 type III secretion system protein PrgO [Enterococcus faecalis]MBX8991686.1 type III secretion system protein PrgO [Escherichia coli]MBF0725325.1 type III secretion system protein PrgO [Enterococcus gallinarum]MBF0799249.1 type III secretion system protein PrgO [Enterococcus gallinarum]MDL4876733.1 DNA segregation protein PrgO [Enterococcus gallinarum]
MALLPTNKKNNNIGAEDIVIDDDLKVELGEKKYTAKERRPVQVDPPVLKTIRNLSYAKDIPMYDIVKLAVDAYVESLSPEERTIYERRNI